MSTKQVKKPSLKGAIGDHINSRQQVISEIVNPEIDSKRNAAIAKSPKIRIDDLQTVPGMRGTYVQFRKGANVESAMANFMDVVGVANTGGGNYQERARLSKANRKISDVEEIEFN